jgi:hypothetical protein
MAHGLSQRKKFKIGSQLTSEVLLDLEPVPDDEDGSDEEEDPAKHLNNHIGKQRVLKTVESFC